MKKTPLCDKSANNAFTIIELLVVMAILAILMGLLVPAVNILRESGKATECSNNLRQWGHAMAAYLDDKRGVFPSDGADGGTGTPSAKQADAWYNTLPPYLHEETMAALVAADKVLIPGRGKSIFLCPNSRIDSGQSSSKFYSSYALNYWINADKGEGFSKRIRQTQIKNPSVFVVMSESPDGKSANVHPSTMIIDGGFTGFRHRGSANALFADGRVSKIPQKIGWRDGMALRDNAGGFQWNPQDEIIQ